VHELIEARDEKRLLRLQRQLASHKLLIVDELGYVPLSQTGAELLFEVFSQRYERGATIVPLRTLSARCCCIAATLMKWRCEGLAHRSAKAEITSVNQ
jgi:IstB-like ATP binding protein